MKKMMYIILGALFSMIIALPSYADVFNQTSADKGREVMDRYYYSNE